MWTAKHNTDVTYYVSFCIICRMTHLTFPSVHIMHWWKCQMSKTFTGGAVCREFESEAPAAEEMLERCWTRPLDREEWLDCLCASHKMNLTSVHYIYKLLQLQMVPYCSLHGTLCCPVQHHLFICYSYFVKKTSLSREWFLYLDCS